MGLKFLIDSNVVSQPVKRIPNESVLAKLHEHEGEIAISATVWHELHFGMQMMPTSRKRKLVEEYLNDVVAEAVPVLPYDEWAAAWHAKERARLRAIGLMPPFEDSQIAAVAAVNNLTVVTANIKDFQNFDGIRLVNWHLESNQ